MNLAVGLAVVISDNAYASPCCSTQQIGLFVVNRLPGGYYLRYEPVCQEESIIEAKFAAAAMSPGMCIPVK